MVRDGTTTGALPRGQPKAQPSLWEPLWSPAQSRRQTAPPGPCPPFACHPERVRSVTHRERSHLFPPAGRS